MSMFPIKAKLGKTEYTLSRTNDKANSGLLTLEAVADDGVKLTIVFPDSMIRQLVKRAIKVSLRLEADTKMSRMFYDVFAPVYPMDIFDDEGK